MMRRFCDAVYDGMICNYFNFRHRTPLQIFLPFMMFVVLCTIPSVVLFCIGSEYAVWLAAVTGTILLCPTVGMMTRRLHDTAESGLALWTLFGAIAFASLMMWYESDQLPLTAEFDDAALYSESQMVLAIFGFINLGIVATLIWKLTRPTAEAYTPWDYSGEYPYPPMRRRKNRHK